MKPRIINPKAFLEAMRNADPNAMFRMEGSIIVGDQEETFPLEGYEEPDNYPNCCDYHKEVLAQAKERYEIFPDCCEPHKKLKSAPWFRKEHYSSYPQKALKVLDYTWHCILSHINNENWHKEILDYIIYTYESFGFFPKEYGPPFITEFYLKKLEQRLLADKNLPVDKREVLIEDVRNFHAVDESEPMPEGEMPDLIELDRIYREWLNIFPFELSFFQFMKPQFEQQRPVLESIEKPNLYSNTVRGRLVSVNRLEEWLTDTTDALLTAINTLVLHEKGLLTDAIAVQLELLLASRRQKIDIGYTNASPNNKTKYRRIVKAWLKDEKKFIKELIPLLQDKPLPTSSEKASDTPILNEQAAITFFEIVKDFFPKKQQADLQRLLNGKKPKEKLLFLENGNKLADAFKQLFEANFITGCQKKELERWILEHFEYRYRNDIKKFTARYLQDIISTEKDTCRKPILAVIKEKTTGQYQITQA